MALGPHDTVVVLQDSSELPAPVASALLDWSTVATTRFVHAAGRGRCRQHAGAPCWTGVDSLFQRSDCQPFHVDDDPGHVEFCAGRRFTLGFAANAQAERRWGGDRDLVFARLRHGQAKRACWRTWSSCAVMSTRLPRAWPQPPAVPAMACTTRLTAT